jgi:hypothetical protein
MLTNKDATIIAMVEDCAQASNALVDWFASQDIPPLEAVIVMSVLLTGIADADAMSDRKINKCLKHTRALVRALAKERKKQ